VSSAHERPVVALTGAAGTIGSAIARELARREARLVLVDRDEDALRSLAALRADHLLLAEDVSAEGAAARVLDAARDRFGRLDAVVNNAGIAGPVGPIEDAPFAEVERVFDVNVLAVVRVLQAVIPHFRARGNGRVVNVASGAGLAGTAYLAAYSATKHAVVGLTRSVAAELARCGVSVNAVCPGCVASPMMGRIEAALADALGAPASFEAAIPAGRYARPEEVANLTAYLALDAPPYLTGAAVVLDGAMRA